MRFAKDSDMMKLSKIVSQESSSTQNQSEQQRSNPRLSSVSSEIMPPSPGPLSPGPLSPSRHVSVTSVTSDLPSDTLKFLRFAGEKSVLFYSRITTDLIYWWIDWLIDWLTDWYVDWLTDWLIKLCCTATKGVARISCRAEKYVCDWSYDYRFYSVASLKGETSVIVFYHCYREAPYRVEPDPSPVYRASSRRTICSSRRPHSCTRLWRQTQIFPTRARATRRRNPTRWPYHPRAPRTRVRRFVPRTSSAIVGRDEMQAVRGFWRGRGARRRRVA